MSLHRDEKSDPMADQVLDRHYKRGLWLLMVLILFLGMMGRLESTTAKPELHPTVERIPACDHDLK